MVRKEKRQNMLAEIGSLLHPRPRQRSIISEREMELFPLKGGKGRFSGIDCPSNSGRADGRWEKVKTNYSPF